MKTQRDWDSDEECTEEACWKLLNLDDELIEEDLMPEFEIFVRGTIDHDDLNEERKKCLNVRFVNNWNLEIEFVVEKKKKKESETKLVDVVGVTIANFLGDHEKIKILEIPKTLKEELIVWLRDLKWRTI